MCVWVGGSEFAYTEPSRNESAMAGGGFILVFGSGGSWMRMEGLNGYERV